MALFCPATGLEVFTLPEWINQKVSDTLIVNFWIVGGSIVYSLPEGRADLEGVRNGSKLKEKVATFLSEDSGQYIQIQDYALLKGFSIAARRYFIGKAINDKNLLSMVFCNLSPSQSISVKIGNRFNTTGRQIHVAKHYGDAVKLAIGISGREDLNTDISLKELCRSFSNPNRSLTPVEIISKDAWQIQTPEYSNKAVVIDQCILHSTSEGQIQSEHLPLIEQMRSMCQSALSEDSSIKYIVFDSSSLKVASTSVRLKYMQALKRWHQRFPLRMYIVYGANTFVGTAFRLARPLMPFNVKIAKDLVDAFHLIRHDRYGNLSKKHAIQESEKPAVVNHEDIEQLMAILGSINWEQEGIDDSFDMGEDHPLYVLYQSVRIIKDELDDLFKERKRLEEQLHQSRKMESIGTLAGGVAHDFNNLLHVITGNAELALEDISQSNPAYDPLVEINSASSRAASIVKQLLKFSRKIDQALKPIDAIAVIKNALKFLRSAIPTTIEIRMQLPDTDVTVLADSTQINQLLMNLCNNAAQEMEQTGGILEIIVEKVHLGNEAIDSYSDLTEGDYLKIAVRDTGPGIDTEIIDRIFDPYFTTREVGKGSGMGLSIVHGIVKSHNGAITVDSQPGQGATFTMLFPVVTEEPVMKAKELDEITLGNEMILFVDDDESIVRMTQKLLERLGYRVETRPNPIEALELFQSKSHEFDLVITDMTMPQMSGVILSEKLKGIRADIPVIICTGYSSLIDEEKAKGLGIDGFVMKPIIKKVIAKTIREVIGNAKKI